MEWFNIDISRYNQLNTDKERKNLLLEIKIKLCDCSDVDLKQISRNVDFRPIFSQLTSNDSERIQEICEILRILLKGVEVGELHRRYPSEMRQLLSHPNPSVKLIILQQLQTTACSDKSSQLLEDPDLLVIAAEKIGDDDLSVATCAMQVFKSIGEQPKGPRFLYSGLLLRTFARLLSKNDIVSFRVYEVVAHIATSSKPALEASIDSGFLQSLISKLDANDDVLLQLNALEIIKNLALNEEGLKYLEEQGVLRDLAQKIARAEDDPLSTLIVPGLIKLFGSVAQVQPNEIFARYPAVVSALMDVLESQDQSLLPTALDTLSHVASSVQGKYALQSLGDSMRRMLARIADMVTNMPTEIRVRALQSLAAILRVDESQQDNRILSLTKEWFDSMADDSMTLLVSLCKQPFADIREAALRVLAVVASQAWGQEYISNLPDLLGFLLDRKIETFEVCKTTKYEVVLNLSKAPAGIFHNLISQKFKQFVEQGALFVEAQSEIDTENAM